MSGPASALLASCTFPSAGTPVTCAVSGGADSLALLVLAAEAGCQVTAVHVDHGLRPGSHAEADLVREAAGRVGASFRSERVVVQPGPNLEARARRARYGVLPRGVLVGHTADDQAETMLLNLLRGAGLDGLGAMRPGPTDDAHPAVRRPILGLRRDQTRSLCAALGLDVVEDPSNLDPAHRRNRVRHELLPLLAAIAGRDVVPVLARQSDLFREVGDHLGEASRAVDPTDARALATLPPALARTVVRRWLRSCSPDCHPPTAATVARVLAVARGEATGTEVGRGWRVDRSGQRLTLTSAATPGGPG